MNDQSPETVEQVADAVEALIDEAGSTGNLTVPRGYPHLGLVVLDAMFSLQARYSTVVNVLSRYCSLPGTVDWDDRFDSNATEHGVDELLAVLSPLSTHERCDLLDNRQIAPGTKKRKADVCVEIADCLKSHNVHGVEDFRNAVESSDELRRDTRKIKGVGPAAWRYMLSLSGVEKVKPDTMVVRWVRGIADPNVTPRAAAHLLESATLTLQQKNINVTVRGIDHLVWRKASGRPLTD